MRADKCVPQKLSKTMMGLAFVAAALVLIVIGVTLLPFVGFILAIPVFALAVWVFRLRLNDQCEIDLPA